MTEPIDTSTSQADSGSVVDPSTAPLSKNALKKIAKQERWEAVKLEKRAKEKEAKKAKKRLKAEKRAAGELDDEEEQKASNKRRRIAPHERFGGRVVVDLGFDSMMNEKEVKSLTSQLAYTYSANRQASFPFELVFTSLDGRTLTRLEGMNEAGYKRWAHTQWWPQSYEKLWKGQTDPEAQLDPALNTIVPTTDQANVIYLTADSDDEILQLKPEETYIIGGICDHNRYKNLCLNKAKESGIRTARLPIGRYLASLQTRKVLTVNQVLEILLRWVETRDWEAAFYAVIPKRKFNIKGQDGNGSAVLSEPVDEEDHNNIAEHEHSE